MQCMVNDVDENRFKPNLVEAATWHCIAELARRYCRRYSIELKQDADECGDRDSIAVLFDGRCVLLFDRSAARLEVPARIDGSRPSSDELGRIPTWRGNSCDYVAALLGVRDVSFVIDAFAEAIGADARPGGRSRCSLRALTYRCFATLSYRLCLSRDFVYFEQAHGDDARGYWLMVRSRKAYLEALAAISPSTDVWRPRDTSEALLNLATIYRKRRKIDDCADALIDLCRHNP